MPARPTHRSDRVEIHYSWLAVSGATTLWLLFGVWMVYWIVLAFSGHLLLLVVGVCAALVGAPVLLTFLSTVVHPWKHRGPVVTFDADGVTDVRKAQSFLPWDDVGQVELGAGNRASFLCFEFRRPDRRREDPPRLGPLGIVLKRAMTLSDWNISLRMLACSKREALAAARRFHQLSVRRQVVERNKDRSWSGTL